ncbi:MAG TPA: PQQ-binding-like beta-propeller repeat protein [Candidatus Limiplasma sp.]|nr:PQQ-binding-like beta-propeller repeat protein [Candidatus Limiplasma sp.]
MSDNHYTNPERPNGKSTPKNSWEQEPFAPYDAPFINPEGTGAPLTDETPDQALAPEDNPFRPYTAPAAAPAEPDGQSAQATRRVQYTAAPSEQPAYAAPQQVNKHTTPAGQPAQDEDAAPRRRGRVARYHEGTAAPQPTADDAQTVRRHAEPDSRYSGARTARPQDPPAGRRPAAQDPYRAPVHSTEGRPQRPGAPVRPPEEAYGFAKPAQKPTMQPPHTHENPPRKGGHGLLILLIVLIVLGGVFAGIWLPDWSSMDGSVAEAMSSAQTMIKDLISPEEIVIRAFSVQPETGTAPVELSFVIYASTDTETIRVIDDQENVLLEKTISDQDRLLGNVTKNSDGNNIWKLRYTFDSAYTGNLTVQAMGSDDQWDVENGLQQAVTIDAAMVYDPPIQAFQCSTVSDEVPVNVSFSIVTSADVSAVRVVNDYGDVIAVLTVDDAGINMTDTGDTRVWTLAGTIDEAYTGSLYVGYELIVGEGFTQSEYRENVEYTPAPIPEDTAAPATEEPVVTEAPTATPAPTAAPTDTPQPTATPTATPEPEPTPTPTPTLMPQLSAAADTGTDSGVIDLSTTIYDGSTKISDYSRSDMINMLDSVKYAIWEQSGVLTFRGGPMRQNAAYGTVEIEENAMSVLWKVAMDGTKRMKDVSLTGVSWPGQAVIVKWPTEVRQMLDIYDEMKEKTALKEVIIGAQNGYLYFLDLTTGEYTRDPIEVSWPSNGSVSVNTDGAPIVSFGQFYSIKTDGTRINNGLHLYNLLNNKQLTLLNGRDKPLQTNYSGFSGAPLFDKNSGTMIVGGQNGVLYVADLNLDFDYIAGTLEMSPTYTRYLWNATGQATKETNVDGSVAVYGQYAYFGDQIGIVQCVNLNTLETVWAARAGDNIDGTPALDLSEDGEELSLYVGTTIKNKTGTPAKFHSFDALSGALNWTFEVPDLTYVSSDPVGITASPIVGLNNVSDLVFFTATNGSSSSTMYALSKADGSVKWSTAFTAPTESSPVAVYNEDGDAWIVQALADGQLLMLNADTGAIKATLQLDGEVRASPAVYRNVLIISTTGSDPSYIYAITLE